jgi:transposase-like protein
MFTMIQTELTDSRLDERQLAAIELLLAGKTITATADEIGVHRNTLSRWVHGNREFRAALRQARSAAVEAAQSRIQELSPLVVDALASIALDPTAGRRDRTQAAAKLLDFAYRSLSSDELERRIDELERRFG